MVDLPLFVWYWSIGWCFLSIHTNTTAVRCKNTTINHLSTAASFLKMWSPNTKTISMFTFVYFKLHLHSFYRCEIYKQTVAMFWKEKTMTFFLKRLYLTRWISSKVQLPTSMLWSKQQGGRKKFSQRVLPSWGLLKTF